MGNLKKFTALPVEKKLLIVFVIICLALPFSFSYPLKETLPLFVWFHGAAGYWLFSGKPIWQASLACYGTSTLGILCVYFGTFGLRILIEKAINWLRKWLKIMVAVVKKAINWLRKRLKIIVIIEKAINWLKEQLKKLTTVIFPKAQIAAELEKRSTWILLFFFFVPVLDVIVVTILGARKIKYGHWYLVAANLPRIFIIIGSMSLGIDFGIHFFS